MSTSGSQKYCKGDEQTEKNSWSWKERLCLAVRQKERFRLSLSSLWSCPPLSRTPVEGQTPLIKFEGDTLPRIAMKGETSPEPRQPSLQPFVRQTPGEGEALLLKLEEETLPRIKMEGDTLADIKLKENIPPHIEMERETKPNTE